MSYSGLFRVISRLALAGVLASLVVACGEPIREKSVDVSAVKDFGASPVFSSATSCRAILLGSFGQCDNADCQAITLGQATRCATRDCQGMVYGNIGFCQSSDCRAYVFGNPGLCSSSICRALSQHQIAFCN